MSVVDVVSLVEHHAMPVNLEEGPSITAQQSYPSRPPRQPQCFDLLHHIFWEGQLPHELFVVGQTALGVSIVKSSSDCEEMAGVLLDRREARGTYMMVWSSSCEFAVSPRAS